MKLNFRPVVKKGGQENLRSSGLVSLTSGPGKMMEQIPLEAIPRHTKNEMVTGNSH